MQIEVGDLMQWEDNPEALGSLAGKLFLVVGLVDYEHKHYPDVVGLQDGAREVWSFGIVRSWSTVVQRAEHSCKM